MLLTGIDTGSITQAIMNVGFPIAMCCAMAWYVKYSTDKQREEVRQLNEQHDSEMSKVTDALNNNTLAIQKLCDKLGEERKIC